MRDIAVRLDDVNMGGWVAFARAILSGMYLADPLAAHTWCARGLALPQVEAFPGSATVCSTTSARPRAAAACSPRPSGSVLALTRARCSSGCCSTGRGIGSSPRRPGRRPRIATTASGDRLDGTLNLYWLGRVRRLLAAHEAAEAALAEGLAVALQGPQIPAEVLLRAELALLAADSGRLEAGRAELGRCQEIIRTGEDSRGLSGRVALAAGLLAAADGRRGEAGEAFAASVETFHAYACSWDEAEARSLWAKALPAKPGSGKWPPTIPPHRRRSTLGRLGSRTRGLTAAPAEPGPGVRTSSQLLKPCGSAARRSRSALFLELAGRTHDPAEASARRGSALQVRDMCSTTHVRSCPGPPREIRGTPVDLICAPQLTSAAGALATSRSADREARSFRPASHSM